jgi:hypothetical protein
MFYLSFISFLLFLSFSNVFAGEKLSLYPITQESKYGDLKEFFGKFLVKEYNKNIIMASHPKEEYLLIYNGSQEIGIYYKSGKSVFLPLNLNNPRLIAVNCALTKSHIFIFFAGEKGMVVSIKLGGNNRISKPIHLSITHPITNGTAIEGGKVFFKDILGNLYCYAVREEYMEEIWVNLSDYSKIIADSREKILYHDNKLYLSINGGSILVLNAENGATMKKLDCNGGLHSKIIDIRKKNGSIWGLSTNGLFQFSLYSLGITQELLGISPISKMCFLNNKTGKYIYFHDNKFLFIVNGDNLENYKKIPLKKTSSQLYFWDPIVKNNRIIIPNNRGGVFIIDGITEKITKLQSNLSRISDISPIFFQNILCFHCNFSYEKIFKGFIIKKY